MSVIEKDGFRFGVKDCEGRQSSVYRVWKGKKTNDIYLANRNVAGDIKVSLHESGHWQISLTEQYVRNPYIKQLAVTYHDRHFMKWERPVEIDGITRAFAVVFPTSELGAKHKNNDNKKIIWLDAAGVGKLLCVEFVYYSNKIDNFRFISEDGGCVTVLSNIQINNMLNFVSFFRSMPVNGAISFNLESIRRKIRSNSAITLKDSDWDPNKSKKRIVSICKGSDGIPYFIDASLAS